MQYIKNGLLVMMGLLLGACSHANRTTVQSVKFVRYAETIPPIQVPAGIKNPTGDSYYPVPPIASTAPLGAKPPVSPPGSHLIPQKKNAQLPMPT